MSTKTPIQTIVNEYADPALAVYARSPQQLQRVEGANIIIQQVTENITQVVTQVTQVYPNVSNVAGGNTGDVQFNVDDKLTADQPDEFKYNSVTNTLVVAGNVTTGNIRTDNLLKYDGQPWNFVTYTNVNVSSYLNVFNGNISANIVTANAFSGNGALLTNIANTSIVGNVAMATEAALANVANIAYRVDAGNVVGKVSSANLADDSVRIAAANIVGVVATANIAYNVNAANIAGTVATANLANIANIAYNVDAGNISGKVASAANADFANTVTSAVQSNIQAVGNLRFLNVVAPDPILGVVGDGNIQANNISLLANVSANYVLANVFWANVKDTPNTLTAYGITSGDTLLYSDEKAQTWIANNTSNVKGNVITANTFVGEGGNISNIAWANIANKPSFSNVATSGSYDDLTNKPGIPSIAGLATETYVNNKATWANITDKPLFSNVATSGAYSDLSGKPTLANVATTGSYNDLTNKPSIPTDLDSLTDVTITTPTNGQVLKYNGSAWINSTDSIGAGATNEITNTDGINTWKVSVATTGVISMNTGRGGIEFGAMPEIGGPTHLHIMRPAGQESSTDLYFGDDFNFIRTLGRYGVGSEGVEIGSSYDSGAVNVWRFDTNGKLKLPAGGEIVNSTGTNLLSGLLSWAEPPASNTSAGTPGQIAYDAGGNLYVCVANETWAKFSGTLSW